MMLQQDMKHKEIRIHPTQKPIALYRWCLKNYAQAGWKILDTHGGSGTCAVACEIEKFDWIAGIFNGARVNNAFIRFY